MKKKNCSMLVATLFVLAWATACGVSNEPRSAANNQPAAQTATNSSPATATPDAVSDKPPAGSLATPTEAYKTAYAARQKQDVQGLKRVLSKDILDFFAMMAEAEKKTLDDELQQLATKPQSPTAESRNEKITGDTATLEYVDDKGKWKTMDFVKEDDGWKLTIPKPKPGEVEIEGGTKKPN
jgi:hypothetical protein